MSQPPELPPYRTISRALRSTTERLAAELHAPQARAPAFDDFEWEVARAVAVMQGISVLLARGLRWRGPDSFHSFLDTQVRQSVERDALIARRLARVDALFCEASLGAVALKGSALRKLDLYRPGERPMADIDLLIAGGQRDAAGAVIEKLGYEKAFVGPRDTTYTPRDPESTDPFGEHTARPITVEIHEHVATELPHTPVEITARLLPATLRPGINAYPDTASLLLHLLLHAAGNMRAHALRLIQLTDIVRLAPQLSRRGWDGLFEAAGGERAFWLYPPLALCARYFPRSLPDPVLACAAEACPAHLRSAARRWSLTDVSWSNLRIAALPGLVWANSLGEAARFARGRLLPAAEIRSRLAYAHANYPRVAQVPWYGLSQRGRVLRWLFSRPPRVQTMFSIHAARAGGAP